MRVGHLAELAHGEKSVVLMQGAFACGDIVPGCAKKNASRNVRVYVLGSSVFQTWR